MPSPIPLLAALSLGSPSLAGQATLSASGPAAQVEAGPVGCWEVVGHASWSWSQGRRRGAHGDAGFVGRLEDGVWKAFVVRSLGEDHEAARRATVRLYDHQRPHFLPLVGRVDDGRELWDPSNGDGLVEGFVAALAGDDAGASWVTTAEDDALTLHLALEGPLTLQAHRKLRVHDAAAVITGRTLPEGVFPEAEVLTFEVGSVGFRASVSQAVTYRTFRACGGDADATYVPLIP